MRHRCDTITSSDEGGGVAGEERLSENDIDEAGRRLVEPLEAKQGARVARRSLARFLHVCGNRYPVDLLQAEHDARRHLRRIIQS